MAKNEFKNWFEDLRRLNEELEPFFGSNLLSDDNEFAGTGLPEETDGKTENNVVPDRHFKIDEDLFFGNELSDSVRKANFFKDLGDRYEMTVTIPGLATNLQDNEDAVKVEVTEDDLGYKYVEVSYDYTDRKGNGNSWFTHSQKTTVGLPKDANHDTLTACFDENNNVAIRVDKLRQNDGPAKRTIKVTRS